MYGWRWDEDSARVTHPLHWGTGNGWVAAGIARSLRILGARGTADAASRDFAEQAGPPPPPAVPARLLGPPGRGRLVPQRRRRPVDLQRGEPRPDARLRDAGERRVGEHLGEV